MPSLGSYPNVFNTCLVILRRKGFSIGYDRSADQWTAEKGGFTFLADNPIELLGLGSVFEELSPTKDSEYWWQLLEPDILGELDPE